MHLLLWTVLTNVFLDYLHVELVIFFYHSITWAIPTCSMCNLKLKKCSINIIQTLHSVYIHIYILKMFTCYYTPTNKDWGYKGITSICLSVHPVFVSRHISVYKNTYITGMFCRDAGPDTILALFNQI
jgi:hypothetical protein